jgi:predicted nucleic acid-binding protein
MSDMLVDSSVVAKWILPEADSAHAQLLVSDSAQRNDRLVILDLAYSEVANAIWKQHYRGLATLAEARVFLDSLLHCPVHVVSAVRLLPIAFEIAAKYQRSIYDSLFVALVQDLNSPGITADEPLYQAIQKDYPQIVLLRNWKPHPTP